MKKLNKKQLAEVAKRKDITVRREVLTKQQLAALMTEAQRINSFVTARRKRLAATRKEFNATKRALNTNKALSTFCKSAKRNCQAFRIDEALTEFHSMKELLALETLSDCKESRIKSHISFLQHEFRHSCKIVHEENSKRFKFISI